MPSWKVGILINPPLREKTFTMCRSMQNIQYLCGAGRGLLKCCCKQVRKVDKNNYCSEASTQDVNLMRRCVMLHNEELASSD